MNGNVTKILLHNTERIELCGNVTITGEAFRVLALNKITVFFSPYGKCEDFSLDYGEHKNVFLRKKQFLLTEDNKNKTSIARSIVSGKIRNQLAFVQRIKRNEYDDFDEEFFLQRINTLKNIQKNVDRCHDIEKLRGYEGLAARTYFEIFDAHIKPEWAVFGKRSQHPPLSNVNSLLSFLYTLLTHKIIRAIECEGLDPMAGTLHELSYGKKVLSFDLMEEFRTPVVDALALLLINRELIKEINFESFEDGSVYMDEKGRSIAVRWFERKMNEIFSDIIKSQVRLYKNVIEGKSKIYEPYCYK